MSAKREPLVLMLSISSLVKLDIEMDLILCGGVMPRRTPEHLEQTNDPTVMST